jgi:hypothetical protein
MSTPYKVWAYSVSHGTLLIRKPGTNGEQNHDHIFYGVKTMDFPDGLYFDILEVSLYEVGADANHPTLYDLSGTFNGEQVAAYISASGYENKYSDYDFVFQDNKSIPESYEL